MAKIKESFLLEFFYKGIIMVNVPYKCLFLMVFHILSEKNKNILGIKE